MTYTTLGVRDTITGCCLRAERARVGARLLALVLDLLLEDVLQVHML